MGVILSVLITCGIISYYNRYSIADITIDKVSKELSEATNKYDELYEFHEGLAKVCKNKKYGFIDKLGHEIIPCIYDEVEDFNMDISIVTKDEKKGAINQQGHWVIPCKYDNISSFSKDSLAVASINEKSGFIDLKGNIVVPFDYEYCGTFSEGLADVHKDGLVGFINKRGELIIHFQNFGLYNKCGFSEGLIGVCQNRKWGYIDKTGRIIIPFQDGLTGIPFSSGLSVRYKGGLSISYDNNGIPTAIQNTPPKAAFINKKGDLASEYFEMQNVVGFRDGYCVIQDKFGKEGMINTHGDVVIPYECSFIADGVGEKYVMFSKNGKNGIVNKYTGQIVIPCIYEIEYAGWTFNEGVIPVKKDGKFGYINESNQIIIPFIYDKAGAFSEGFAVVQRYGKYGYVDKYGHDTFN